MRFEIFIFFIVVLFSCSGNNNAITNKEVDKFISKYNDVRFDDLKDISITQRSRDAGEIVYIVGKGDGNLPVYIVTFDLQKKKIANVNKANLENSKMKDYLTSDEIINAINVIRKYDFYFFAIDSLENVYINPFFANEPPYLLRLETSTGDSLIKLGYAYELYKNKWYLNRTTRKK